MIPPLWQKAKKNYKGPLMKGKEETEKAGLKLSSGHRTAKGQFSFQSLRKAMTKNAKTTTQSHASHTLAK